MAFKCKFNIIYLILPFLFLFLSSIVIADIGVEDNIIIIVNKNAPQTEFTKIDLQKIFIGKITLWDSKDPIVIAVQNDQQNHIRFLNKYVQRNPSQFLHVWRKILFLGKGNLPTTTRDNENMIAFVSENKYAIGYIIGNTESKNVTCISY